jgi:uncharacterized protein with HEPN domain
VRDDRERLLDIQEAIGRIERYTARGQAAFAADELIQTWVVHHIQIIGEAVRGLSTDFRTRHPEVPWVQIVGMRNVLVHAYFGINLARVWSVVERDVPPFKQQVNQLWRRSRTERAQILAEGTPS